MSPYFVYVLECADNTYYVGCTNNLARRLKQHNGSKKGAHYTKIRRPVVLKYFEKFGMLLVARRREVEIKTWNRKKKQNLWYTFVGMKAPDFELRDQDDALRRLGDYSGRWLLIYFYPKDDTPGCTKEACSFRDQGENFVKRGISILGVSKDSVFSHKKFAEKYNLNFPLLSDPTAEVIKAYGAWGKKKFMGREYDGIMRNSYLVDPKGEIVKKYEGVSPLVHSKEVLSDFEVLVSK